MYMEELQMGTFSNNNPNREQAIQLLTVAKKIQVCFDEASVYIDSLAHFRTSP